MRKTKRQLKMEAVARLREQYDIPAEIKPSRWGDTKTFNRFNYLKGILWAVFSVYIRKRDMGLLADQGEYEGHPAYMGRCICCGKRKDYSEMQAGHFAPVGGGSIDLCFDEKNVNAECAGCNADFHGWHLIPMRRNLVGKYGEEVVIHIEQRRDSQASVKWSEADLVERIHFYWGHINK